MFALRKRQQQKSIQFIASRVRLDVEASYYYVIVAAQVVVLPPLAANFPHTNLLPTNQNLLDAALAH